MPTDQAIYQDYEIEMSDDRRMCMGSTPIDGIVMAHWPSTQKIQRQLSYKDGLMHGEQVYRNPEGDLSEITNYNNGEKLFTEEAYYDNGNKSRQVTQDNISNTYTTTRFYENGNPRDSITKNQSAPQYKQDSYMEYHENGNLKKHSQFLDGTMVGVNTSFDEQGVPVNQSIYNKGQELIQLISGSIPNHFDNDTLVELAQMMDDLPHLLDKSLLSDGNQKILDFIVSNSESPEFLNEGLNDKSLIGQLTPKPYSNNEVMANPSLKDQFKPTGYRSFTPK